MTNSTDILGPIDAASGQRLTTDTVSSSPARNRAEVMARLRAAEGDIRAHGVTALYLFGSAARDELRLDSDVDVFVDAERSPAPRPFSLIDLVALREELPLILGRNVDVFTRRGLHRLLAADIQATAIQVF
jgi:uncharacterized protein